MKRRVFVPHYVRIEKTAISNRATATNQTVLLNINSYSEYTQEMEKKKKIESK